MSVTAGPRRRAGGVHAGRGRLGCHRLTLPCDPARRSLSRDTASSKSYDNSATRQPPEHAYARIGKHRGQSVERLGGVERIWPESGTDCCSCVTICLMGVSVARGQGRYLVIQRYGVRSLACRCHDGCATNSVRCIANSVVPDWLRGTGHCSVLWRRRCLDHREPAGSSRQRLCCAGTDGESPGTGPNAHAHQDGQPPAPRFVASSSLWPTTTPTWGYRRITAELTRLGYRPATASVEMAPSDICGRSAGRRPPRCAGTGPRVDDRGR